jgi:hypothetical protein
VRTEIIRRADIEATSARSLADAIEFTTGVRIENNCQNCNFSQIRLLGLDGPYTQILYDGQPSFSLPSVPSARKKPIAIFCLYGGYRLEKWLRSINWSKNTANDCTGWFTI